jgi:hypothetical protein
MTKRILIIKADGTETELNHVPLLDEMMKIIGGMVDNIRVVDRIEQRRPVFTYMAVHDQGLVIGLPRNAKATEIYQRNIRLQHPGHPSPFRAITEAWKESMSKHGEVHDLTPQEAKNAGYEDDPWIAGTVIYWQGYTCEEVNEAYELADSSENPTL